MLIPFLATIETAFWMEILGDKDIEGREQATRALIRPGCSAFPMLKAELESKDPEVRARVEAILSEKPFIQIAECIALSLSRLESDDPEVWTGAIRRLIAAGDAALPPLRAVEGAPAFRARQLLDILESSGSTSWSGMERLAGTSGLP